MDSIALDKLINSLERMIDDVHLGQTKWKPIWNVIRQIGGSFKGTCYPTLDDKQEAWNKFQSLVQLVKDAQVEDSARWERISGESERYKYIILACASAATPPSGFIEGVAAIVMLPKYFIRAAVDAALPGPKFDEARETLDYCSRKLHEGWELLSRYKLEMLGRDKKEVFEALKQAQELLDSAWERWKSARQETREARHEAREAWEERIRKNIENLEERLRRLLDVLNHKEGHLEELREKRDSARSDEFRELVEGWIDEEEENIRGVKAKIENIEMWLDEARAKI